MRYGSTDGQALFPLVLLGMKEGDEVAKDFEKERSGVPLSMFLPWINQLVAHSSAVPALEGLMVDLAGSYPTHLRPPLEISRSSTTKGGDSSRLSRPLESHLPVDRAWETFIKCADYLQPPEKAVKEFLSSTSWVFNHLCNKFLGKLEVMSPLKETKRKWPPSGPPSSICPLPGRILRTARSTTISAERIPPGWKSF